MYVCIFHTCIFHTYIFHTCIFHTCIISIRSISSFSEEHGLFLARLLLHLDSVDGWFCEVVIPRSRRVTFINLGCGSWIDDIHCHSDVASRRKLISDLFDRFPLRLWDVLEREEHEEDEEETEDDERVLNQNDLRRKEEEIGWIF